MKYLNINSAGIAVLLLMFHSAVTQAAAPAMSPVFEESAEGSMLSSSDCIIDPHKVVKISSSVEGLLTEIRVERGDMVKAGALVATLESRVERAAVDLAKERSDFGRRKVERNDELYAKNMISINEKDELETDSFLSLMELKHAEAILAQRTIYSPIDGVVVERYFSEGEFVHSEPIVKVAQMNPLNVEVILPVSALGRVKQGMTAIVFPQAPIKEGYSARVVIVDKVVDAASGTIGVRLLLQNPGNRIPAGLKCRVDFNHTGY